LRKEEAALRKGSLELLENAGLPHGILAYKRKLGDKEILVLLNFSKSKKEFKANGNWVKLFSINPDDVFENGKILLNTYGGIVLQKSGL
jgi:glycosidase